MNLTQGYALFINLPRRPISPHGERSRWRWYPVVETIKDKRNDWICYFRPADSHRRMSIQVRIVASSVLEFNNFGIVLDYTLESLELNCNDS